MTDETVLTLPKNARCELQPGETYVPMVADEVVREVTGRSIVFGTMMMLLFSAAATYIALKLGQGIETAIPIAVLAIGLSAVAKRKSGLLENVNILAIGSTSGIIVGGTTFVMPAIFILNLGEPNSWATFLMVFLAPFLGAVLGVLLLIPFRHYFTTEMHGKLSFPEATATLEILLAGVRGGKQSRTLLTFLGLGFVLDYYSLALKAWSDVFTTSLIPAFDIFTSKFKCVFGMNTAAAMVGLGVIIGVKYAAIIVAGAVLVNFVLVPLAAFVSPLYGAHSFGEIFKGFQDVTGAMIPGIKSIGIGGIVVAGIITIIKMSPTIKDSLSQVVGRLFRKHTGTERITSRWERDIPLTVVLVIGALLVMVMLAYFRFVVLPSAEAPWTVSLLSLIMVVVVAFLFTAVSAWAIATISVTPVSGMTLATLIIAAVVLVALGLKGNMGMTAILLIGAVVCTALSMAGSLVTQFKIGQWLGATPRTIQWSNILASFLASAAVAGVVMLFAHVYGFGEATKAHPNPLAAPQATAMAAVAQAFMGGGTPPWAFYAFGAVISISVTMLGTSALAFALGMYLPMELNTSILLGAIVAWLINRSAGSNKVLAKTRNDKAILVASGLIAGGALAGVFDGLVKTTGFQWTFGIPESLGNWICLFVFSALCVLVYFSSCRAKMQE